MGLSLLSFCLLVVTAPTFSKGAIKRPEGWQNLPLPEDELDILPEGYLVHFVNISEFAAWREGLGPDAILYRQGSLVILHRMQRDTNPNKETSHKKIYTHRVITPVFNITGSKEFNETDCLKMEDVAVLLRSDTLPDAKRDMIEPKTCKMRQGLECLTFEDEITGDVTQRCGCNLIYGPDAVFTNYTKHGREFQHCFIPAETGWSSECQKKSWWNFGYPLPFGDPAGSNAEKAAQRDSYISKLAVSYGVLKIVEYIKWNSVKPVCVPNAACRETQNFIGQRCHCKKQYRRRATTQKGYCLEAATLSQSWILNLLPIGLATASLLL